MLQTIEPDLIATLSQNVTTLEENITTVWREFGYSVNVTESCNFSIDINQGLYPHGQIEEKILIKYTVSRAVDSSTLLSWHLDIPGHHDWTCSEVCRGVLMCSRGV